jgi:hypothetical protein
MLHFASKKWLTARTDIISTISDNMLARFASHQFMCRRESCGIAFYFGVVFLAINFPPSPFARMLS